MTEPELKKDGDAAPAAVGTDAQGQATVTPIADKPAEPKRINASTLRKKRAVPVAVVAVVAVVVLALAAFIGFRVMTGLKPAAVPDLAVATGTQSASSSAVAEGPLAVYAKGSLVKLVTYATPQAIENISFIDRDKKPVQLTDFKGQVVVLNVWATWCAPCRFEMPTLAHLQTLYAGKAVKVLPLSGDTEEYFADVKSFMDVQQPLEVYADQSFQAQSKYKISGLPATLILDKQGRLVARLDGEAKWDTPEVQALLDKLLAE